MRSTALSWWVFNRLLIVFLLAVVLLLIHLNNAFHEMARDHQREMLSLQAVLARDIFRADPEAARFAAGADYARLARELAELTASRVTITDTDGHVLADSRFGNHHSVQFAEASDVRRALMGEIGYAFRSPTDDDPGRQSVAVPLRHRGRVRGALRLSQPHEPADSLFSRLLAHALLPVLVILAALALCALLISRRIGHVVGDYAGFAFQFGNGKLNARPPLADLDDFAPLSHGLGDMADRLQLAIRDLQREKQHWEALFTSMREGILAVDHESVIISLNQSARTVLGIPDSRQATGQPLFSIVRNANLNRFMRDLFQNDADYLERELDIRNPAGDTHTYRLSGVRFTFPDDDELGALVVLHDITRLRRLENMRRDFVANVSHELKTPITTIKGFLETLRHSLADDPEQSAAFVDIMATQADRLNAIIDDLLTLSRLEQADQLVSQDFEDADVRDTVDQAVGACAARIEERRISLDKQIPSRILHANHRLLEQALRNLIDNAVKYSPEEAVVSITCRETEEHLELAVQDHGVGIPKAHLNRIFERFYRVDKSRDRQTGGTGLGLSIVKHILRLHGGGIRVSSEPQEGSCFVMQLPKRLVRNQDTPLANTV